MPDSYETMGSSGQSCDSGVSGVEKFFNSIVPQLESQFESRFGTQASDCSDSTIDLEDEIDFQMEQFNRTSPIKRSTPIKQTKSNAGRNNNNNKNKNHNDNSISKNTTTNNNLSNINFIAKQTDSTLDELKIVIEQFKRKSPYAVKLAKLMGKHLEESLGPAVYNLFLTRKLPETWLPLVKMNDDNTPYVEFLVKSKISDETPFEQITNCSETLLAYSDLITKTLPDILLDKNEQLQLQPYRTAMMITQENHHYQQQQQKQSNKTFVKKTQQPSSVMSKPCPQKTTVKRSSRSLLATKQNDDEIVAIKRSTPSRACKSNIANISYSNYY